jgi:deferrochelatase/peroxidase EfeB
LADGCPIMGIDAEGPHSMRDCPARIGSDSPDYRNPPPASVRLGNIARFSHMNRTNPKRQRGRIGDRDNRIFRQGYEFLEALPGGRLRIGVNFVSFQRSISALTGILTSEGWLGDANFGGERSRGRPTILSLIGGGYYAVPPAGQPFPGADIF